MIMAKEVYVLLFPAQGGGVQVMRTPQGDMPVPIPQIEYKRVRTEPEISHFNGYCIVKFVTREGDTIESNLPYLVRHTETGD